MKGNLFLTLLHDKWMILPTYADNNLHIVSKILNKDWEASEDKNAFKTQVHHIALSNAQDVSTTNTKQVAVIDLNGAVTKYDTWCNYGAMTIANAIKSADLNKDISSIVLNIDSPGGASTGATLLAQAIQNCSKPIIAHIAHGMAASAAYWAASQCDEIYLSYATDSVGSIGAYCSLQIANESETDRYRIKTIYAPQSKDKNGDIRNLIENDDASGIESTLESLVNVFINDVKTVRGAKLKSDEVFTGKMYQAEEAMQLGLVDGIQNFDSTLQRAASLSTQKKQTNKMANKLLIATLATALGWAEGFETSEDGIFINAQEATDLNAHLEALNNTIQSHTDQQTQIEAAQARQTELEGQIQTLTQEVNSWKAKAIQFGARPATSGTVVPDTQDPPPPNTNTKVDLDPVTAEAMRMYNVRNKK